MDEPNSSARPGAGSVMTVIGVLLFIVGTLVLSGWVWSSADLVGLGMTLAPMHPSTAAVLVAAGLSLFLLALRQHTWAGLAALAVVAICIATLAEFAARTHIGIDLLVVRDLPGVLAPSGPVPLPTSVCGLLAGLALVVLAGDDVLPRMLRPIAAALGAATATIPVLVLLASAFGMLGLWSAENLAGMGLPTCVAFVLLGVGIAVAARHGEASSSPTLAGALTVGLVPLTITVFLWWLLTEQERRRLADRIDAHAATVSYDIARQVYGLAASLQGIALRLAASGGLPHDATRIDATAYQRNFAGVDAVIWLHDSIHGEPLTPGAIDSDVQRAVVRAVAPLVDSLGAQRDSATVMDVSGAIPDGFPFLIATPVCGGGGCSGLMVAILGGVNLVRAGLNPTVSDFSVAVLSGPDTMYKTAGAANVRGWRDGASVPLRFGSVLWQVTVWPTPATLVASRSAIPGITLLLGTAVSGLMVLALHFAQISKLRAVTLERQRATLEESDRRFRGIFDSAFQFQGLTDLNYRILELNHTTLAFAGTDLHAMRGRLLWDLPLWSDSTAIQNRLREACLEATRGDTARHIVEATGVSDRRAVLDLTVKPLRDGSGTVVQLLIEGRDITGLRQAEAALRELEALSTMGRLAARVAHEINNPLQGIQNAFLLIKDAVPTSHPHFGYVGAIEREIQRIAGVTRQLYETYRPEHNTAQDSSVRVIVSDVVALLSQVNRRSHVRIEVSIADSVRPSIPVPEAFLRQAVYNLVQNAVEASPPGGKVVVSASQEDGALELAVRDWGPGVPPASRGRIFESFYSTKSGLSTGGMGLGLALVRRSIVALGGEIAILDPPDGGAVFRLRIPIHSRQSAVTP